MIDSFATGADEGWRLQGQSLGSHHVGNAGGVAFTTTAAPMSNSYNISEFSSAN